MSEKDEDTMQLFEYCVRHANAFIKGIDSDNPEALFVALCAHTALLEHMIVHHYGPVVERAAEKWSTVRNDFLALSAMYCEQVTTAEKNTTTFH